MVKYDKSVLLTCVPLTCTLFLRENAFSMFKLNPLQPTSAQGQKDIVDIVRCGLLREYQLHQENGVYPEFMGAYLANRYGLYAKELTKELIDNIMMKFTSELVDDPSITIQVTVYPSMLGCQFDVKLYGDTMGTRFIDPENYSYTDLVQSTDGDMRDNYWLRIDTLAKYNQLEGTVFLLNRQMPSYFEEQQ